MNCPPCTGNCNQGRDCPAEFPRATLALRCYIVACILVLVCWVAFVLWLLVSGGAR